MNSDCYTRWFAPVAAIIIKICRAYTDTQQGFEDYYQEVRLQIWELYDAIRKLSEVDRAVILLYLEEKMLIRTDDFRVYARCFGHLLRTLARPDLALPGLIAH